MEEDFSPARAGLKTAVILAAASTLVYALMVVIVSRQQASGKIPASDPASGTIAVIPYTITDHTDLGQNYLPSVTVPTAINQLTQPLSYLIDTGALLTTIPAHYSQNYGLDLESLPRIILSSLTDQTVFGYLTPARLEFDPQPITLPVAFAAISTPVLGRQGLLDRYTLTFDHLNQQVVIQGN